ncbi:Stk1 family PASTA domain-containing Ser/Thr kinase [Frankia sp. AgB32]|uniref:Stk1 family PASTA domain-containing Ser/Thr kinase n=1 Tax=Frankia sp. AgB32 TaxID=631119 RepID=UPI00200EA73D|nr:Stk1 family PASTA domain-containing Ser/Thr kinase [Frankia sp. AgB32]MCK9894068.1 PASTA domain-containing protein [Frankia sp. AgB32]
MADPVIGRLLDGRYTAQERLAVGGMATVYVAHDNRLDRLVALKVMHPNLNHDPEFIGRFHREARAVAQLNTSRVVSVLDQGSDRTSAGLINYLVMELVRGRSLRQHLGARGPLPVTEAVEIIEPVMEALAAAHHAGIIHRDIKPENILLGDDGQVKVADFGLARPLGQPTQALTDGVVMGTVGYLAPEQVTHGTADTRSDVYAAGVVLFETLTGQLPHSGATPMSMAYQSVHGDVPAPSTLVAGIPAELDDLVRRATSRDPGGRPADGAALLDELLRIAPYLPAQTDYPTGFTAEVQRIGLMDPPPAEGSPGRPPSRPGAAGAAAAGGAAYGTGGHGGNGSDVPGGDGGPVATAAMPAPTRAAQVGPVATDTQSGAFVPDEFGMAGENHAYAGGHDVSPGTGALYRPAAGGGHQGTGHQGPGSGGRRRAKTGGPRRLPILVGAGTVLVLLLALVAFHTVSGNKVEVPLLTNLSKSDAEMTLRQAGLKSAYLDPVASATVTANHIAQQDPHDGSKVAKGAVVTLRLSSGPATIPVPDLANLTQDQANARLAEVNLTPGGTRNAASDSVAEGHVIATDPAVNTPAKPKDSILLIISSGPDTPLMPADIIGRTYDAAKAQLEGAGIAGLTVQRAVITNSNATPDTVVGVSPEVGQPVPPNSTVTLTVATSPDDGTGSGGGGDGSGVQVTVPNVVGKTFRDAESLLRRAGLKIDRASILGTPNDKVVQQSTRAGSKIEKGSTVRVNTVWQFGN